MTADNNIVLVYVPCGSEQEAAEIARKLLAERLIACGNIHTSRSLYNWKEQFTDEQEYVLLCKTSSSRAEAAAKRIAELHSYEVPCIIQLRPLAVNRAYASWLMGAVAGDSQSAERGNSQTETAVGGGDGS